MGAGGRQTWVHREILSTRFFFWVFWFGLHWGLFAYGWYSQAHNERLAGLNSLKFSVWFSRGAGLVLALDCGLILLPMCRNILKVVRPKVKFLPLDESQWFHRQVAYSLMLYSIIHTTAHYVNFFNVEKTQIRPLRAVDIHYTEPGGITGHVMLLCMVLMYTTAHHKIRNQCFEAFWYTHHLALIFFLALYTHATGCFVRDTALPFSPFDEKPFWAHCIGYQSWRYTLGPGILYFMERVYRLVRSRRSTQITKVIRHPYNAVEIQFNKPSFRYKAGQWLFINVPDVSGYQWHPFTITSCPSDPYVSVHVRQVGDFTSALGERLGAGKDSKGMEQMSMDPSAMFEVALQNGMKMPTLRVDGPYGAPAEDVFENEIAVLIGTGIGVTPWASILKSIWHKRQGPNPPTRLRRVEFIWVCKEVASFEWFHTLLSSLERQGQGDGYNSSTSQDFLRIHIYLTAKLDIDTAQNIVLNSVGAELDPLTELRSRTNFGRPDFKRLFSAMRDGIMDQTYISGLEGGLRKKVGVYFCGPNVAARSIKQACKQVTTDEVHFGFWKEHF